MEYTTDYADLVALIPFLGGRLAEFVPNTTGIKNVRDSPPLSCYRLICQCCSVHFEQLAELTFGASCCCVRWMVQALAIPMCTTVVTLSLIVVMNILWRIIYTLNIPDLRIYLRRS